MPNAMIKELESTVARLHEERQTHLNAIAEIEAAFEDLGIAPGSAPVRRKAGGRKAKTAVKVKAAPGRKKKAGRGKAATGNRYAVSGTQSILAIIKQGGKKGVAGSAIDKHWKADGRAGSAYNIMGQLVKAKKIKRVKVKGQRGSMYVLA